MSFPDLFDDLFIYIFQFINDSDLIHLIYISKTFKKKIETYLSEKKTLDITNHYDVISTSNVNNLLKLMNNVVYVNMRFNQEIQFVTIKLIIETFKKNIFVNSVILTPSKWKLHKSKIPYIFMLDEFKQSCGQIITFIKFYDILYGLNLQYSHVYPIASNSLCFYFFNLKRNNQQLTNVSISELKIILFNILTKSYSGDRILKNETDLIFDVTNT